MIAIYVLSREAGRDLEEIEDYTATHWGDGQAEEYLEGIFRAFDTLAKHPELGRSRVDVPQPYLTYSVGSHAIIYRYHSLAERVEVLNVLHPAMNVHGRLQDSPCSDETTQERLVQMTASL